MRTVTVLIPASEARSIVEERECVSNIRSDGLYAVGVHPGHGLVGVRCLLLPVGPFALADAWDNAMPDDSIEPVPALLLERVEHLQMGYCVRGDGRGAEVGHLHARDAYADRLETSIRRMVGSLVAVNVLPKWCDIGTVRSIVEATVAMNPDTKPFDPNVYTSLCECYRFDPDGAPLLELVHVRCGVPVIQVCEALSELVHPRGFDSTTPVQLLCLADMNRAADAVVSRRHADRVLREEDYAAWYSVQTGPSRPYFTK